VYFKKKGKIYSSLIPMMGGSDFKVKDYPVCAVMKNKRSKKPSAILVEEKKQWHLRERVLSDSSGKSKVKSLQGNQYFSIFVCARSGRKLYFAHKKKSHYPLVYLKFVARVGRAPRLLVTDQADEILSKTMGVRLAAQGTDMEPVPKDEHSKLGSAERAIDETCRMVAVVMLEINVPKYAWDIVGEHCSLINAVTQSCPTDSSITIYEAESGMIPDLDKIPPFGCVAIRYLRKLDRKDFKLSPKNQDGVFFGFATFSNGTYRSVLLIGDRRFVVAKKTMDFFHD